MTLAARSCASLQEPGETFILADIGPGADRFVIFGSQANIDFLRPCETWISDGTFKVGPKPWALRGRKGYALRGPKPYRGRKGPKPWAQI